MESIQRPYVTPERYRELEVLTMQIMMQLPHENLGECLIISDIGTNILRRWVENERMARHEIASRQGTTLFASGDGNVIHLKSAD